ncbi:hypothetical protein AAKU52_002942 [Pedobacter sp. CG_S7]
MRPLSDILYLTKLFTYFRPYLYKNDGRLVVVDYRYRSGPQKSDRLVVK